MQDVREGNVTTKRKQNKLIEPSLSINIENRGSISINIEATFVSTANSTAKHLN